MLSIFFKKNALINFSIFVVSIAASLMIGYFVYRYLMQPPRPAVYQGQESDYALSFYNSNGQKLSELNGNLKLRTDPFTIYANYPNQTSASYSIDTEGFRSTYIKNPAPEKLAIVIGGSAAFGQGLSNDNNTFASHISRLNDKYRVINAGTVGFLSGQELSQMVHVLDRLAPSIYIVFDGWNDIFDPYMYTGIWPINGGPIGFNNTFFMVEKQLADSFHNKHQSGNVTAMDLSPASKTFKSEHEYFKEIISTYISNISRMNAFANARKAKFLIVFQPELTNKKTLSKDEEESLNNWNNAYKYHDKKIPDNYNQLIQYAKKLCNEQNIAYIDINKEKLFSENSHTLFYDVVHPNEEGHKIIAELVNKILIEKF